MWKDFSDFELAELAGRYGLEDMLEFNSDFSLANRQGVENLLTLEEYDIAFGVDNNTELM